MNKMFLKLPMGVRMLIIATIYAVILIGHIGIVYYYNKNVAEVVDTKEIVVATREIGIHQVITADDVKLEPVKLKNMIPGAYESLDDVVGKESQVKIVVNDQLHESKIGVKVKEEGEMIIEMPQDWVISFPKSLRRFDKINILPIEQESEVNNNMFGINDENRMLREEDRKKRAAELLKQVNDRLTGISVVYFKDNTANDITDQAPNSVTNDTDEPRITSSSLGTRLEIAITPDEWEIIQGLYEVNYKFVVGYQ